MPPHAAADLGAALLPPLAVVTLGVAALLLAAALAVRFAARLGVPSLLVFLALGVACSPFARPWLADSADLVVDVGWLALAVILAEGGLTTRWARMRPVAPVAVVLATVGVAVSTVVVALAAGVLLGLDTRMALLLGAVVSSTDAAAVFATLRALRVRPRLVTVLEAESGLNDAPVAIVVALLSSAAFGEQGPLLVVGLVAYELVVGAALGLAVGRCGVWLLRRAAMPIAGLYPIAVVALALLAFAAALAVAGSGFLAVYVAAVVLGNASLPHRRLTLGFSEALAWVAQIGLFVLLGLLVEVRDLPGAVLPAVIAGSVLLLLARPLSVAVSTVWFRYAPREVAFLSWAGLRGAVPIVFALIPVAADVPGADELFATVFVLVVVFTLVQGRGLPMVGRRLGVAVPTEATELEVDAAPLEAIDADLLQVRIAPGSKLNGVYLSDLRLPPGASVGLVLRSGAAVPLSPDVRLQVADQLLVVAPAGTRATVERRLRSVSRGGLLARWSGDAGDEPGARPGPSPRRPVP